MQEEVEVWPIKWLSIPNKSGRCVYNSNIIVNES